MNNPRNGSHLGRTRTPNFEPVKLDKLHFYREQRSSITLSTSHPGAKDIPEPFDKILCAQVQQASDVSDGNMENSLGLNTDGSNGLRRVIRSMPSHAVESGLHFAPKVSLCTSRMKLRLLVVNACIRMRLNPQAKRNPLCQYSLGAYRLSWWRFFSYDSVAQSRWFALRSR